MALLFADENFLMPAVVVLRELGHDVQTLLEIGQAGLAVPDDEVLQLSTSLNRCLLTLNRKDFIKLHRQSSNHAGIIICKADAAFAALAHRTHVCIQQQTNSLTGQLLRVQRSTL
ncbi:DUF5615 family PIN-like protein [Spirosoma spitsbergense]|uniref:DUF5615 family PIN-like protein n=1 Tax=Spirosoma spitsbergense TaxID=431554 RepID=UPI00037CF1DF|nr:DUF5615 family PIN-like protein [Spirosoma spitsbergense]